MKLSSTWPRRGAEILHGDLRPLLALAWPVMATEVAWMLMGVVDTMVVGRIGAEAIGAVSVGSNLFFAVAIFGGGMLFGLDHAVAHAFGAGRRSDARRAMVHGLIMALALSVLLGAVFAALLQHLDLLGMNARLEREARGYLRAVAPSVLPMLLFVALRRTLQARGVVRPILAIAVFGNVLNLILAWALVLGHLGLPAWGAEGAGWATTIARSALLIALVGVVVATERAEGVPWTREDLRLEPQRFAALIRLGFPAAVQVTLEVGVFAAATTLAARLDPVSIAAHQIALNLASLTFMVPLGLSSATAVRVGQALGAARPDEAVRRGWTALGLGAVVMLAGLLAFVLFPHVLLRIFTTDVAVLAAGVSLLRLAAGFQLFDGLQVVATGALRGAGDTRTPMLANLFGHWAIGLPIGWVLAFPGGLGVYGLWIGLSAGLVLVAVRLLWAWSIRARELSGLPAAAFTLPASTAPPR